MSIHIATKTLEAIENCLVADQGASYRGHLGRVIPFMDDAYRDKKEDFRSHMGASLIGGHCGRAIWYGFRWATAKKFGGRMVRLFNRGHLEEARFIAMLLAIGCQVYQQDEHGKQFRISDVGGHFGGAGDGVAIGVPDLAPGTPALCEFKTYSLKTFTGLKEDGMRAYKPEHYVQMQVYMRKMGLGVGLYLAVCKDNDELYGEIVPLDTATGDMFIGRAATLVPMHQAPKRISESPSWFKCKFCDHKPMCHFKAEPERNCRTCQFATPDVTGTDGKWKCENKERQVQLLFPATNPLGEDFTLTKERQLKACEHYVVNESFR